MLRAVGLYLSTIGLGVYALASTDTVPNADLLLDTFNDSRDYTRLIVDLVAKRDSALASATAYQEIHTRQTAALNQGVASPDEWELSLLQKEVSEKEAAAIRETIHEMVARKDLKDAFLTSILDKPLPTTALYALYRRIWDAECRRAKSEHAAARAEVRLAGFRSSVADHLQAQNAGSVYDQILRKKELTAAKANLQAKKSLEDTCEQDVLSLDDVRKKLKRGK